MASKRITVRRGPMGNAVWTVGGHRYYWNGPGARLKLMFGEQLVSIDHPSADGNYRTYGEALAALRRFTGASVRRRRS
jgi:hypothetical protein